MRLATKLRVQTYTRQTTDRLRKTQLAIERSLLGIKRADRIQNRAVLEKTRSINIRYWIKKQK